VIDIGAGRFICDECGHHFDLWAMAGNVTTRRVRKMLREFGWRYRRMYITPAEFHGSAREWVMVDLCMMCAKKWRG
jgi:transposase